MSPLSTAGAENVRTIVANAADGQPEPPRPLMRELAPADPYPVDALGDVLAGAARAIHDRVQAPLAICGQSVLAAATLANAGAGRHRAADGPRKPLSTYLVSVAGTGERKSAVDHEALWPVRKHEAALRETYTVEALAHRNAAEAWDAARKAAIKRGKGNRGAIAAALDALGRRRWPPLLPVLTCSEPTFEGMCRLLAEGNRASASSLRGWYVYRRPRDGRGCQAAHGRRLSAVWDGDEIKARARERGRCPLARQARCAASHGPARRGAIWMSDPLLIEQGLMSRVLMTAPNRRAARACGGSARPTAAWRSALQPALLGASWSARCRSCRNA